MASARKKQDEKNLKTLRELGALPQNKYCFECNQRGPTYVDVTIGSFVCTKCSGMLRGITPPHRVKSISMATFAGEEIEFLRNRGNDYCRQVWLGLYEGVTPSTESNRDETTIRDLMIDKYEKKRFYLDPSQALRNGHHSKIQEVKPLASLVNDAKPLKVNGTSTDFNRKRPEAPKFNGFADFNNVDAFNTNSNNNQTRQQPPQQQQQNQQQVSFANFDDNPVFNNNTTDEFSIFDLSFTNSGPVLNQVPLFPKCNTNRWSMPTPASFDNTNLAQTSTAGKVQAPPAEDKYAALKDLDNAFKSQTQVQVVDWNSSGSNGSLYSSSTPTGSMYSSPSPQSSMFGSPSQGQFMNAFPENGFSNPFGGGVSTNGMTWGVSNGNGVAGTHHQPYQNPFRDPVRVDGFLQNFQPAVFPVAANGAPWGANPFKVGGTASINSNNPFL